MAGVKADEIRTNATDERIQKPHRAPSWSTAPDDAHAHPARTLAAQLPVKRTEHAQEPIDYSQLIRSIQYLEECLRRGVVVGVYSDSMEVSDEDMRKALTGVNNLLAETARLIDVNARALTRLNGQMTGSPSLQ